MAAGLPALACAGERDNRMGFLGPFGAFGLLSLFYIVIGLRLVYQLVRHWRAVWDDQFTVHDRMLVDQAAFFVLIPISVVLHEFGHAIAIWSFGGRVTDFGFYGFAGYVAYNEPFTPVQQTVVAAAGSIVNLLLCLLGLAFVLYKRPPARASINELLMAFVYVSGINAFVVYPVLDLFSSLNGDWRQMYFDSPRWMAMIIVAVQLAILVFGYWLYKDPGMRRRLSELTGVPPGYERGILGGLQPVAPQMQTLSPIERTLKDAADRVSSGWPVPVQVSLNRQPTMSMMVVAWSNQGAEHAVLTNAHDGGQVELWGIGGHNGAANPAYLRREALRRWPSMPTSDELVMALRVGMERVSSW